MKNRIIGNQSSLQFCKSRDHALYLLSCVHRILTRESRLYSPKGLHSALILLDVFLQTLIIFHNSTFLHTYSDLHCNVLSFVSLIGRMIIFTVVRCVLHSVNISTYEIKTSYHRKCLNGFYAFVTMHQKSHSFAAFARSFFYITTRA